MQTKQYVHIFFLLASTPIPGLTQALLNKNKQLLLTYSLLVLALMLGNISKIFLDKQNATYYLIGLSAFWLCLTGVSLLQAIFKIAVLSKHQAWPIYTKSKLALNGIPIFWIAIVVCLLLKPAFLIGADFYKIQGRSMWPTLQPGDWVIVDPRVDEVPEMGSIVIAKTSIMNYFLIKRASPFPKDYPSTTDSVWLLGDNPEGSSDSRAFGSVPVDAIHGKVAWVWAP